MHSSPSPPPFSISLALLTLFTTLPFTEAQTSTSKSDPAMTLKLITVPAYPSTWSVSANCFQSFAAVDDNQETIYNVGCGVQVRKSCCPPGWSPGVVFGGMTSTVSGRGVCPSGYVDRPNWGSTTGVPGGPVLIGAQGTGDRTVVCCPRQINFWSTFGRSGDPLCFTQSPRSGGGGEISTYARPFFLAVEAVVTASITETTSSRATTRSSSSSLSVTTSGSPVPSETGGRDNSDSNDNRGLSSGAIAGIVVGVVLPIVLGICAFIFWRRKRVLGARGIEKGIDPPVPPPADPRNESSTYPLYGSGSSSPGYPETRGYGYQFPATSETFLTPSGITMMNGEHERPHDERRVAVFENAEKLQEPGNRENEEHLRNHKVLNEQPRNQKVYNEEVTKFGGTSVA